MRYKKRTVILSVFVIILLVALGLILILKLVGFDISDWFFIADSLLLTICGILYKNNYQADKEEEKYGG